MKKTLTVNLGGTVFHIDEDAYQLLDKYLSNLRIHFRKEEGSEEIMNDFETRISELFSERIRLGYDVITIQQVEEMITRMGKPEEIFGDSFSETEKEEFKAKVETETTVRRLYRNPDDRVLGGVAGGLAAYLGWDPTAVRIALILLMCLWGVIIPIYLILWLIIPMARTAAEKLQMRGESVTIENIGKTVTDGFEKVSNNVNEYVNSGKPRNTLQKLGDAFVTIIGAIIKVLGVLIGIILLPPILIILFVLVVVFFAMIVALLGGGIGILGVLMPFADWNILSSYPETSLLLASISSILLIGIPIIALVYLIGGQAFNWKPMSSGMKWTLLILWIIALISSIIFANNIGPLWDNWHYWDNLSLPIRHIRFW